MAAWVCAHRGFADPWVASEHTWLRMLIAAASSHEGNYCEQLQNASLRVHVAARAKMPRSGAAGDAGQVAKLLSC